jgi:hypothetical protein
MQKNLPNSANRHFLLGFGQKRRKHVATKSATSYNTVSYTLQHNLNTISLQATTQESYSQLQATT